MKTYKKSLQAHVSSKQILQSMLNLILHLPKPRSEAAVKAAIKRLSETPTWRCSLPQIPLGLSKNPPCRTSFQVACAAVMSYQRQHVQLTGSPQQRHGPNLWPALLHTEVWKIATNSNHLCKDGPFAELRSDLMLFKLQTVFGSSTSDRAAPNQTENHPPPVKLRRSGLRRHNSGSQAPFKATCWCS